MPLRIGAESPRSLRDLHQAQESRLRALDRLGSATRIRSAAAAAAGLALSENLRAIESATEQVVRNLSDGIGAVRTADAGLGEISSRVDRMRELSVRAQNETLGEQDRELLQAEFDSLSAEVTRIAESTSFNGRTLLDGGTAGPDAIEISDAGDGEPIEIAIEDHSAGALGLEGLDVSSPEALDALDAAQHGASAARADLGATEGRISREISSRLTEHENAAAARERIADADFAVETANAARDEILEQAALVVRAQANVANSAALRLLGA